MLAARLCVNDDRSTRFWLDHWFGQEPVWRNHPSLYQLATNIDILMADALRTNPPAIYFKRPLSGAERAGWDELRGELAVVSLRPKADTVSWSLTSSRKFLVKSLYNKLTEGPALDIARGYGK